MYQEDENINRRIKTRTVIPANGQWGESVATSYEQVHSNVRVEDLLYYRDKARRENCWHESVCWEFPDGRLIQLYPDVKILDSIDELKPGPGNTPFVQTVFRPETNEKDYAPMENKLPWGKIYKERDFIPWYVWPLRPILLWVFLITCLVMWPLWTVAAWCALCYTGMAYLMFRGEIVCNGGFWGYLIGFLLAPLEALFFLLIASLGMMPIL